MEKELNTDTQTALLELRGFFRDERSVFLCRFIKLPNISAYLIRMTNQMKASVYKGYKRDKIEMRVDRVEVSDFPLYLNTVAGGLDRRDQTIGGFSFVVKIYALPVVEIIG